MTAPFKTWTVLPHGELIPVNERILTVVGELKMPLLHLPRRMSVVRLRSGDLVIFSAIALDDANMAKLEAFGRPAFLVAPSEMHRLDAPSYADRYPSIQVIAPAEGADKIGEVVRVDTSEPTFGDPSVRYVQVVGDSALEVESQDGLTVIVNDIIGDIHDAHGFEGFLLKSMGFAGDEPHVPGPVKMQLGKKKSELAAQFRRWAEAPHLKRIIVSHGDIIDHEPSVALIALASRLD